MASLGRRLNEVEISAYNHVPAGLSRRVRVIRIPFIPGGYSGMTMGTWVLVAVPVPADGTSALMAHELVHVRQWNELGRIRFARSYVMSFLRALRVEKAWKAAYWLVEAEREARDETKSWQELRSSEPPSQT